MMSPAFFQQDKAKIAETNARLEAITGELTTAYVRWEELEALRAE